MKNTHHPLDVYNMRNVIFQEYAQFREGRDAFESAEVAPFESVDKIVVLGMGGSALPGDLVSLYLKHLFKGGVVQPFSITTSRSYHLPL